MRAKWSRLHGAGEGATLGVAVIRLLRRLFLISVLLLLSVAVWAAIYAQEKGFTRTWRELVEEEFALRGYYVDIGKLTLGPFQGLVAEEVRFFQDPQRRRELAFVDNVILDLDLSDVINRNLSVNTLDVQDAKLALPLTPGRRDSELLMVERFSARLVVTESQIEVVRAQAEVAGVAVSMEGSLFRPPREVVVPELTEEEAEVQAEVQRLQLLEIRRRLVRVRRVLDELERFDFPAANPPRLEIEFAGDLADLAHLHATVRLSAQDFRRGAYAVSRLNAQAEYDGANQRGILKEWRLRDGAGDLRLRGEWSVAEKVVDFEMESSADLPALAATIWPDPRLGEVVFFSAPKVRAEGTLRLEGIEKAVWPHLPLELMGELRSERFGSRGMVFDGMEMQFAVSGDRYYARNLRLDHKSGILLANLMYEPSREEERFRFQSEIKLDPAVLLPFVTSERTKQFLAEWQFDESSAVYLAAFGAGASLDPSTWETEGLIDLRRFRRQGVAFDHLETEYAARGGEHWFRNLAVERPEGALTASMVRHHSGERIWEARDLHSTLDLMDTLRVVSPSVMKSLEVFRFSQPPEVKLEGIFDAREGSDDPAAEAARHDFTLEFQSDQSATLDFLGRPLPLGAPSGKVVAESGRLRLSDFQAELFGGKVSATFETDRVEKGRDYQATIAAEAVTFDDLLRLYGNSERRAGGDWSGKMAWSGRMGEPRSLVGEGAATLREGNLLAMPVFSPVISDLQKARLALEGQVPLPGAGTGDSPVKPGATMTLALGDGRLTVEEMRVAVEALTLRGGGVVEAAARTLDFEMNVGIEGWPGLEIGVEGRGTLAAPEWRVKLPGVGE